MNTPTIEQLRRAAAIAEEIERLRSELIASLGGQLQRTKAATQSSSAPAARPASAGNGGRRPMSEEGRQRIIAAQKARWAKLKAGQSSSGKAAASNPAPKAKAGKRTVSPEARAKMAEAARQRWAKQKKA